MATNDNLGLAQIKSSENVAMGKLAQINLI